MSLERWNKFKSPPPEALKPIRAGRLKGMTDISPQWRYKVLTEEYGECGIGWKFEIVDLWTESGSDNQVMCFAKINLYTNKLQPKIEGMVADGWSEPIPGIGGSKLVTKESSGLYTSDEGFKMAVTDALSTACKMLGIGADIYMGLDGKNTQPVNVNRKPALTKDKYDAMIGELAKGNWEAVQKRMDSYEMSDSQRKVLEKSIEECKSV